MNSDTSNCKRSCARIATDDYNAVIYGHSQLEEIPLSAETTERQLQEQIDEIDVAMAELKMLRDENFRIRPWINPQILGSRTDSLFALIEK